MKVTNEIRILLRYGYTDKEIRNMDEEELEHTVESILDKNREKQVMKHVPESVDLVNF